MRDMGFDRSKRKRPRPSQGGPGLSDHSGCGCLGGIGDGVKGFPRGISQPSLDSIEQTKNIARRLRRCEAYERSA